MSEPDLFGIRCCGTCMHWRRMDDLAAGQCSANAVPLPGYGNGGGQLVQCIMTLDLAECSKWEGRGK